MGRITFQKRQKEMKRQEKQKMKAEKRALRKLAKNNPGETPEQEFETIPGVDAPGEDLVPAPDPQQQG
jgi:hypothetical protein